MRSCMSEREASGPVRRGESSTWERVSRDLENSYDASDRDFRWAMAESMLLRRERSWVSSVSR